MFYRKRVAQKYSSTGNLFAFTCGVGPAFGVQWGSAVKILLAIAVAYQYEKLEYSDCIFRTNALGVTEELLVKIIPDSHFSPILGLDFSLYGFLGGQAEIEGSIFKMEKSGPFQNFLRTSVKFFLGCAYNF